MGEYKLRIKIGQHEFEAEGTREEVEKDFEQFKQIISNAPRQHPGTSLGMDHQSGGNTEQRTAGPSAAPSAVTVQSVPGSFGKIFRVEANRPLSLSVLPRGENREREAAILLLLGYKEIRQQEEANGIQLLDGLKTSGYNLKRVDRILHAYINIEEPLVTFTGQRRGVKYRLTNRGYAKAKAVAEELIALVI